ncbi:MAG TPA: Lpg1974 family pore-forming outer membrane protein [Gemmataceae bacterium]|nr:Lpg1974 family pore-forming outer membrane protein [Gemmataceae bacterium]
MTATARRLLIVTMLGTVLLGAIRPIWGQAFTAIPESVLPPPTLGTPTPLPAPAPLPPPPVPPPPSPPQASPFAPAGAVATPTDGWDLFGLSSVPLALFANVEVDILKPHLKAALTHPAMFPGGGESTVQPPTSSLNWTAAPRFEIGWYIPEALGLFAFNYRGFAASGQSDATSLDGTPFTLRSRLDVNQIGFDFGTLPYSFAPHWDISGRIGVALADVYFDNRAVSAPQTLQASNNFYGAGPHGRIDVRRHIGLLPGLDLFGRADLSVLVGQIQQRFREGDAQFDGSTINGNFMERRTQTVPVFNLQAGLSYTPPSLSNWRFSTGYEFEQWWSVGQMSGADSRGQFYTNGVFLRAAVNF